MLPDNYPVSATIRLITLTNWNGNLQERGNIPQFNYASRALRDGNITAGIPCNNNQVCARGLRFVFARAHRDVAARVPSVRGQRAVRSRFMGTDPMDMHIQRETFISPTSCTDGNNWSRRLHRINTCTCSIANTAMDFANQYLWFQR